MSEVKSICKNLNKYKFGIEVPNTVEEEQDTDKREVNTFYHDSTNKETNNFRISFKLEPPIGI